MSLQLLSFKSSHDSVSASRMVGDNFPRINIRWLPSGPQNTILFSLCSVRCSIATAWRQRKRYLVTLSCSQLARHSHFPPLAAVLPASVDSMSTGWSYNVTDNTLIFLSVSFKLRMWMLILSLFHSNSDVIVSMLFQSWNCN